MRVDHRNSSNGHPHHIPMGDNHNSSDGRWSLLPTGDHKGRPYYTPRSVVPSCMVGATLVVARYQMVVRYQMKS